MDPRQILDRNFLSRLIGVTVFIIVLAAFLSALFFYLSFNTSLGDSYGRKIEVLSYLKLGVVRQSIAIFVAFAIITVLEIIVFGIVYTHKIVGPLVRIRAVAGELSRRNFDVRVKLREGDAIHPIADSLNTFAKVYGDKYHEIDIWTEELHKEVSQLMDCLAKGDHEGAGALRESIGNKTDKLNSTLSGIKV